MGWLGGCWGSPSIWGLCSCICRVLPLPDPLPVTLFSHMGADPRVLGQRVSPGGDQPDPYTEQESHWSICSMFA